MVRSQLLVISVAALICLAASAADTQPASGQLDPHTWDWPSSASDPEVRRSIVEGQYTQEELRNIRLQLVGLAMPPPPIDAAHPAEGQIVVNMGPGVKFGGRGFRGLEGPFGGQGYLYGSMTDRTNRVQYIFAKGDKVWVRWFIDGHHTGKMFGFPASGKLLHIPEAAYVRYQDGKLVEADYFGDDFALYTQLGGKIEFPGR
jgi:hypothetical protein